MPFSVLRSLISCWLIPMAVALSCFVIGDGGQGQVGEHLQGEDVPQRIETAVTLVTPENLNEPQVQKPLELPLEEYLP
jgi:ABC-type sugar transport system substrate-binding protein